MSKDQKDQSKDQKAQKDPAKDFQDRQEEHRDMQERLTEAGKEMVPGLPNQQGLRKPEDLEDLNYPEKTKKLEHDPQAPRDPDDPSKPLIDPVPGPDHHPNPRPKPDTGVVMNPASDKK